MTDRILDDLNALVLPCMTKSAKALVVGNQGMIIFDTTAKKISIKTEVATAISSWELVTSSDDS
jgi:hypothetical protein